MLRASGAATTVNDNDSGTMKVEEEEEEEKETSKQQADDHQKQQQSSDPAGSGEGSAGGILNKISGLTKRLTSALNLDGQTASRFKFWNTQPVPKLGEEIEEDGPIECNLLRDKIRSDPIPLPAGYEWTELDLADEEGDMMILYNLLKGNYVEDLHTTFRFDYSRQLLKWALMPPGWKKQWHAAVRVSATKKIVAFIAAVPMQIRIRKHEQEMVEVNFLCVHKKLRAKRLAPVLIKEITRRVNQEGIFQAVYTSGTFLPTPVSTCQYFHRSINPKKLIEIQFSYLRQNMTMARTIKLFKLPTETRLAGWREARPDDMPAIHKLLGEFLQRFDFTQQFTEEEVRHYFTPIPGVMNSFVVENPETHELTDFVSYYTLWNTVLGNDKHNAMKAAFLWFYATATSTTTGDGKPKDQLEDRLRDLVNDALITAKQSDHDVMNALNTMDNAGFLEDLKFAPGDGNLHYYLYNYRSRQVPSDKQAFLVI